MGATATPFDSHAAEGEVRPVIRYKPDGSGKKELIFARWGTNPRFAAGLKYRFVRSEGHTFGSQRCLIPASEFRMRVGKKDYRVMLDDGNFFYLAGVWEPEMAGWPLAFKIITVTANPDVLQYQDRHGAIILRRQVMDWLDASVPAAELLVPPAAHTFTIAEMDAKHPRREKPMLAGFARS